MKKFLLAAFMLAASTSLTAETIFYSGNLRTDATVTACGSSCTLNSSDTDYQYAQFAAAVYSFTVYTTTTMEAITYSYGGGTSLTGATVLAGGLEPYLSLFDSAVDFLASTFFSGCPAGAHYVGPNCFDVELDGGTLTPGVYEIALTAYQNASYAENNGPPAKLADGFIGIGNLAPTENLNYAFDVILPANTPPAVAPEPGTIGLMLAGTAAIAVANLRRIKR